MPMYSLCEQTIAVHRAGQVSTRIGAVDGRLTVTDARVVFEPSVVERLLGQRPWELSHEAVREVTLRPRDLRAWRSWLNAGCSPTIVITDHEGEARELVTRNPRRAVLDLCGEIEAALPLAA